MRCTECKKEVPAGNGYCPYCGTPMNPQANPQTNLPPQTYPLKIRNALGIPVLTFNANGVDFNLVKVEKGSFYRGSSLEMIQDYIKKRQDWKSILPLVTWCCLPLIGYVVIFMIIENVKPVLYKY